MKKNITVTGALDKIWNTSMIPLLRQYDELKKIETTSSSRLKREELPLLRLTELMLLRQMNRHKEADALCIKREKQFNNIKNKLYAHRWKRMKLVEQMRKNNTATAAAAKALADEASANNWIEEELRALFLQHLIEMHQGHFALALETAQQVKLLAQKSKNEYFVLQSAWAVAHVHFFFGYYEKSLKECLVVKKLFDENDLSQPQHLTFFNLLANCYQTQKKLTPAIKLYERILEHIKTPETADSLIYIAASSNLATALIEKGQLNKAEKIYMAVDVFAQKNSWHNYRLDSQLNLARLYLKQNRLNEMRAAVEEAERLSAQIKILRLEVSVLQLRAQYEKAAGNTANALAAHEKYFSKYRQWQTLEDAEKIKAIETAHQLQIQQLNHEVMKKEYQLQEQEIQLLNSQLHQKDKLITQFADYFTELEQTSIRRKEIFLKLRSMVNTVKQTQQYERAGYSAKFNEAHHASKDVLMKRFPGISNAEANTAIMLTKSLSNKEIATLTLTTVRNVEKHRLSLRKKLHLKRNDDLVQALRKEILTH